MKAIAAAGIAAMTIAATDAQADNADLYGFSATLAEPYVSEDLGPQKLGGISVETKNKGDVFCWQDEEEAVDQAQDGLLDRGYSIIREGSTSYRFLISVHAARTTEGLGKCLYEVEITIEAPRIVDGMIGTHVVATFESIGLSEYRVEDAVSEAIDGMLFQLDGGFASVE